MNPNGDVGSRPPQDGVAARTKQAVRLLLYLGGLFASALVGVWVKGQAEKAELRVRISSITTLPPTVQQLVMNQLDKTLQGAQRADPVTADERLKALTLNHSWLPQPDEESRDAYIASLLQISDTADDILRSMSDLRAEMEEWPQSYEATARDSIFRMVREHVELVLGHVFGEAKRGTQMFEGPEPALGGLTPRYRTERDDDGDIHLVQGKLVLPIPWTQYAESNADREKYRPIAERLARAISYGVPADLDALKVSLGRIFQEEASTAEIMSIVDRELLRHSHWFVTVTIANTGKDTVAVDPRGMLYLKTAGLHYIDHNGAEQTLKTNKRIAVIAVTESRRELAVRSLTTELKADLKASLPAGSPVIVRGGEALTVAYRSTEAIGQQGEGETFLSLFKGDGAPCVLAVVPLTRSKVDPEAQGPSISTLGAFREVKFDSMFAEDVGAWPAE